VIVVNSTYHWKSPQPKAKDSLHVLHGDGHASTATSIIKVPLYFPVKKVPSTSMTDRQY
jgi:hypothetical protein